MSNKQSRPLNKAEQKVFAKIFIASLVKQTAIHYSSDSDKEESGICDAIEDLADKLAGPHPIFATPKLIADYIKTLRK